jgi:hypothetical protein
LGFDSPRLGSGPIRIPVGAILRFTVAFCRPIAFLLTGGRVADCAAVAWLLEKMKGASLPHADKGYDGDAIRRQIEAKGVMPNIPPKANRRWNVRPQIFWDSWQKIRESLARLADVKRLAVGAASGDWQLSVVWSFPF